MEHRLVTALLIIVCLGGCAAVTGRPIEPPARNSQMVEPEVLEQLPSTLSIPHFSKMRLSGTGLTLESVLEKNSAYTRYAISYLSNGLRISGILNIPDGGDRSRS